MVRRKSYGGRRVNRRGRGRRSKISYTKPRNQLLADVAFVKLRYTEPPFAASALTGTANSFNDYIANGIYDPDYEVSAQPSASGFANYTYQYSNWCILGSKITVTFFNESTVHPRAVWVFPQNQSLSGSSTIGTNTSQNVISGQPYVKGRLLGVQGSSRSVATISNYMSTRKLFGLSMPANEPDFFGTSTTDPVHKWYWLVGASRNDVDPLLVDYRVSITYYCKFFGRKVVI